MTSYSPQLFVPEELSMLRIAQRVRDQLNIGIPSWVRP